MKRSHGMKWWATAAVVLGGAVGALAACNLVVDSGSYHVGDVDGSMATITGEAGPTGVDGTAGDGGTVVGTSEAASEAGPPATCGSTALPTTPAFQQLVSACVLAVSCDIGYFVVNISTCITYDYIHAFSSLLPLANIQSCADYYTDEGSSITSPASCTSTIATSDEGSCNINSNVGTTCYYSSGYSNTVTNCDTLGGTCTVYYTDDDDQNEAAGCLLESCSDTDSDQHCDSLGRIYTCISGNAYGGACPTASQCGSINGAVNCYYQTPSCTTPGATCSSGTLSICAASPVSSGAADEVVNYNCGNSGLQCVLDDGGSSGQCLSPGCTESNGDGEGGVQGCTEGCNSGTGVITFCVGGVPGTYDCMANGFTSGCSSDFLPGTSTPIAYCYY